MQIDPKIIIGIDQSMSCSGITVIIDHKGDFEDLDVRFWFTTNVKKYKPIGDLTPITISNKSGFKKLIEVVQGIETLEGDFLASGNSNRVPDVDY